MAQPVRGCKAYAASGCGSERRTRGPQADHESAEDYLSRRATEDAAGVVPSCDWTVKYARTDDWHVRRRLLHEREELWRRDESENAD